MGCVSRVINGKIIMVNGVIMVVMAVNGILIVVNGNNGL